MSDLRHAFMFYARTYHVQSVSSMTKMASFVALNVEPEEDSEEEIDDTKEIQIEEALKLYQTALKLHSQGPLYFDAAQQAYDALFRSEIFTYPESLTDSKRLEVYGDSNIEEEEDENPLLPDSTVNAGISEGAPNTLPQILYLSYKNHGQFLLDRLTHRAQGKKFQKYGSEVLMQDGLRDSAKNVINRFTEALERDDTDHDLWRRTARLSALLKSKRIARLCLESVLSGETNDLEGLTESLGLDAGMAKDGLAHIIDSIDDQLSKDKLDVLFGQEQIIPTSLKDRMDTCPLLPPAPKDLRLGDIVHQSVNRNISVPFRTWAEVGQCILQHALRTEVAFGVGYTISLPLKEVPIAVHLRESPLVETIGKNQVKHSLGTQTFDGKASSHAEAAINLEEATLTAWKPDDVDLMELTHAPNSVPLDTVPISCLSMEDHPSEGNPLIPSADLNVNGTPGTINLPTRKRTLESASIQETGEGGRSRSKRIRAKAENLDEENANANLGAYHDLQLQAISEVDDRIAEHTKKLQSKLGVYEMKTSTEMRQLLAASSERSSLGIAHETKSELVLHDFRNMLHTWDLVKSSMFVHGNGLVDPLEQPRIGTSSGLELFLEHSKPRSHKSSDQPILASDEGLQEWVNSVNKSWISLDSLSMSWIISLLGARSIDGEYNTNQGSSARPSIYLDFTWSHSLKETVVTMLVQQDDYIFGLLRSLIDVLDERVLQLLPRTRIYQELSDEDLIELIQTIFEIHLDVFGLITKPLSLVDQDTRTIQQERLNRWSMLASQAIGYYRTHGDDDDDNSLRSLSLRHLWSVVICLKLTNDTLREHVVLCLEDLKSLITVNGSSVIKLQNNAIMPEVSAEAADLEISKLATMDFFLRIFDENVIDPLKVIHTLEPVLIKFDSGLGDVVGQEDGDTSSDTLSFPDNDFDMDQNGVKTGEPVDIRKSSEVQTQEFLNKSSISLRLFLWRKLRTAYQSINYPPMIFLCNIRTINLILEEFRTPAYIVENTGNRAAILLGWLRNLEGLISGSLQIALDESSAFDFLDDYHLRLSMQSCANLVELMQVFVLWEDSNRIGLSQAPQQFSAHASTAFTSAINRLRVMHVKVWMLQYKIIQEAMLQNSDVFTAPKEDLTKYLKLLHKSFGIRSYCHISKKAFLKLMKTELFSLDTEDWSYDKAQIIFDLYGLRLCQNLQGLEDHGCTPDDLDGPSAIALIDFVVAQVKQISMKDLLKTELRPAIEKMQAVIKSPSQTPPQLFNKRTIDSYLKSPINPLDLYRSLRGIGTLSCKTVDDKFSTIISKGWYFILGHMLFAKFRSQKRVSPIPTNDLDDAICFFRHDLEYGIEKWETWYRLAQVYDALLEESTTWSADKLNKSKHELNVLQRNAVKCYTMAMAIAISFADMSFESVGKISDLCTDFGNRIYSSSREPFSMEAFSLEEARFFSGDVRGIYLKRPFRDLQLYPAWTFAAALFRKASVDKPHLWINSYMLGKCLWKMQNHPGKASDDNLLEMFDAFTKAIENVPERRDSRHPEKEPILEPHYKLVSVICKLVQRRWLMAEEGCQILDATPYARKVSRVEDMDDWEEYILSVLKSLRSADKANWHHRMVARAAHVIYDDSQNDMISAHGAKHELTQQIFTKTMVMQVWRPENERPGRHFVYTGRYVTFFVQLLYQLGDRASLEALAKRIRKKSAEFVDHAKIWQMVCKRYLTLLRFQGSIPDAHEEAIFKLMSYEAFVLNTARMEAWTPLMDSPLMVILREVSELRKLNNSLMKVTLIDDLICDTFARLYEQVVPDLIAKSSNEENRDRMRVDHLMNSDAPGTDVPSPAPSIQATSEQPAPRSRPKIVSRREILRKAEVLVNMKPASPPTNRFPTAHVLAAAPVQEPSSPLPDLVEPASVDVPDIGGTNKEIPSSVPGSVHDSADDESELSDIEEVGEIDGEGEGEDEGEDEGEGEDDGEGIDKDDAPEEIPEATKPTVAPMFPGLMGRSGAEGDETGEDEEEMGDYDADDKDLGMAEGDDVEMKDDGEEGGVKVDEADEEEE